MRRLPVIDRCDAPTLECNRRGCRMHLRGYGSVDGGWPRAKNLCALAIATAGPWNQTTIAALCGVTPQAISAAEAIALAAAKKRK